jgi:hypothetical protein
MPINVNIEIFYNLAGAAMAANISHVWHLKISAAKYQPRHAMKMSANQLANQCHQ